MQRILLEGTWERKKSSDQCIQSSRIETFVDGWPQPEIGMQLIDNLPHLRRWWRELVVWVFMWKTHKVLMIIQLLSPHSIHLVYTSKSVFNFIILLTPQLCLLCKLSELQLHFIFHSFKIDRQLRLLFKISKYKLNYSIQNYRPLINEYYN